MKRDDLERLCREYPGMEALFAHALGGMPSRRLRPKIRLSERALTATDIDLYYTDAVDVFHATCDEVNSKYTVTRNRETVHWTYAMTAARAVHLDIAGFQRTDETIDFIDLNHSEYVPGIPLGQLELFDDLVAIVVLTRETNTYVEHIGFDMHSICKRVSKFDLEVLTVADDFRRAVKALRQLEPTEDSGEDLGGWARGPDDVWRDPTASGPLNPVLRSAL